REFLYLLRGWTGGGSAGGAYRCFIKGEPTTKTILCLYCTLGVRDGPRGKTSPAT
ncbi:hypothetical protein NDU88_004171, partial [Pleurodeles waltl]